ncbi:AraC family transcriptional regulator [Paenibacillus koleovorans]|uniref:AraC family transcriptional regulator n=1 Tax=Paenibacillus koleovorans TaxID=121608 RepID=UPI000FD8CD7A|nr:AraC family transcriptional regulator [Paenibacillus koleovorans]
MYPEYLFEYPNRDARFAFHMKRKLQVATPAHRHDFVELTLVAGGSGRETINGAEHPMRPGTMVLLLPYQVHRIVSDPQAPLDLFICNFPIDFIMEIRDDEASLPELLLGESESNDARTYVQLGGDDLAVTRALFEAMLHEAQGDRPFRSVTLRAQLQLALTRFGRSLSDRQEHRPPTAARTTVGTSSLAAANEPVPAPATRSIWPVVRYVYDHYLEPLTLTGLAERFRLHPSTLSEKFVASYGIHFTDLVHELRLRHACSLLRTTELPVAQVAEESGFGSYSSFARIFTKNKGLSPRDYRKHDSRLPTTDPYGS